MTTNRRVVGYPATWFVVGLTLCLPQPAAQANDRKLSLKPVTEALGQMNDDFCQTFKVKCPAKGKPAPKRVEKAKAKQTSGSSNQAPTAADKTSAAVPIPKPRPNRPTAKRAVALETPAKPSPPLPRLRAVQGVTPKVSPIVVVTSAPKPAQQAKPENRASAAIQSKGGAIELVSAPPAAADGDESCLSQLKSAGVRFEAAVAPTDGQNCQVEAPVRMFGVETTAGSIALPENPLLNCKFALQFSLWLSDAAAPGVAARQNAKLAKVATGPGYECRGRNGDSTSKFSEHATGNAVDITTFTLEDGKTIQVADAGNLSATSYQLLRGLRTTACGYFSTVLGPGSNAAHASHFHFDMGRHGKSASYKICD